MLRSCRCHLRGYWIVSTCEVTAEYRGVGKLSDGDEGRRVSYHFFKKICVHGSDRRAQICLKVRAIQVLEIYSQNMYSPDCYFDGKRISNMYSVEDSPTIACWSHCFIVSIFQINFHFITIILSIIIVVTRNRGKQERQTHAQSPPQEDGTES
jgi:hypothetical protein